MASINEIDSRMEQECNEFKELLKYMRECYDKMSDGDSDAVYEKDVIIGFGNRVAHAKGGAATYTALECAITYILEQEYEYEEEEETTPIGSLVKSYYIDEDSEGTFVTGELVTGEMFVSGMPDDCDGFEIHKTKLDWEEGNIDHTIKCDSSKWLMMWNDILDDYDKDDTNKYHASVNMWKECVENAVIGKE